MVNGTKQFPIPDLSLALASPSLFAFLLVLLTRPLERAAFLPGETVLALLLDLGEDAIDLLAEVVGCVIVVLWVVDAQLRTGARDLRQRKTRGPVTAESPAQLVVHQPVQRATQVAGEGDVAAAGNRAFDVE